MAKSYNGDLFVMCPKDKWTGKIDENCVVYTLLKARVGKKYRMLILSAPRSMWYEDGWLKVRDCLHPITQLFYNNIYEMSGGRLSRRTVHIDYISQMWNEDASANTFVHMHVGNLLGSFKSIATRT